MKAVNISVLQDAAARLMFTMSEAQYVKLEQEFAVIIAQMNLIHEIAGVDQAEPMTFPFAVTQTVFREDEPEMPLSLEEVLLNAPAKEGSEFKLPKVVG